MVVTKGIIVDADNKEEAMDNARKKSWGGYGVVPIRARRIKHRKGKYAVLVRPSKFHKIYR